jgi:hypothetical protein
MARINPLSALSASLLVGSVALLAACSGKTETTTPAPECAAIDPLLLNITDLQGSDHFVPQLNEALAAIPRDAADKLLERLRANQTSLDQQNGGRLEKPSTAVAMLHGSRKIEGRTSGAFRYCKGSYAVGNGQMVAWAYSMTAENGSPVFRLLSASIEGQATPLSDSASENSDAVMQQASAPADIANEVTTTSPLPAMPDPGEALAQAERDAQQAREAANLERMRREAAKAEAEAERARRQLEQERQTAERLAAELMAIRVAEESAALEAAALAAAEAARPKIDALFEQRRDECPRGFLGSECRDCLRDQLCAGRWSANPPVGESQCRR